MPVSQGGGHPGLGVRPFSGAGDSLLRRGSLRAQTLIGRTLSHFRITAKLGEGGMGEVYLAQDTQLDRAVAIKVLPPTFADDGARLARFEREARVLAALDHPNIATIHEVGSADGLHYLVMQRADGETLESRLSRGPLPVVDALAVARQLTRALQAAHDAGIVHRDLKPANTMISPEGVAKVLDFGLAKTRGPEPARGDSVSTRTVHLTQDGAILGTAAYMSPEQARGQEVDKRADIFAFGCVLYEMLAGRRAFAGETASDVLAAILRGEPDWSRLPTDTPSEIRRLIGRCLAKDPRHRLHDIADARIILEEVDGPEPRESHMARPGSRRLAAIPWVVAAIALVVAGLSLLLARPSKRGERRSARVTVSVAPAERLAPPLEVRQPFALSDDGASLAYVARGGDESRIYVRRLESFEALPIPGTEGAATPVFSPDGRWIAFVAGQQVMKVALSGGAPVALAQAPDVHGLAWGPDDTIVYQPSWGVGLLRIPSEGGEPQRVTEGTAGEGTHLWPQFLPGGDWVLFTVWRIGGVSEMSIHAVSLATGRIQPVVDGAYAARYASSGHLLFMREDTLMAAPFDAEEVEVTGEAVAVVPDLRVNLNNWNPFYDVASNGSLVYVSGGARWMDQELIWMDREGRAEPALAHTAPFLLPRLSPDDGRVAVNVQGPTFQAWVIDLSSGSQTRMNGIEDSGGAIWMPDGERLVAWSNLPGYYTMVWLTADGSRSPEPLDLPRGSFKRPIDISRDGRYLSYIEENFGGTGFDLMVLDLGEAPLEPRPFLNDAERRGSETAGMFSPDGRWIAYVSDVSGRDEVYITSFPGPGARRQVSTQGGSWPMWSPGGGELFYLSGQTMMSVRIAASSSSPASAPKRLFEGEFTVFRAKNYVPYDVARDGEHFLMMRPAHGDPDPTSINLVLDWFDELERQVPTG